MKPVKMQVITVQRIAVVIGVCLLAVKFFAWFITGSNTVLTDALESIINVVAGCLALYGVTVSTMPKDEDHPYGHGKIEFVVSGIEGGMIALAGAIMIVKSCIDFLSHNPIENLDFGIALIGFSGVVNLGLGRWLVNVGTKEKSLPLVADGKHLQSDAYTSLAALLGLGLIKLTGWNAIDNIVAIAMGGWIAYIGYGLMRRAFAGIMDETDVDLLKNLAALLSRNRIPAWIDVHNLRVIQYGNKLHIDCHITLPNYIPLHEVHDEMENLASIVRAEFGEETEFFIHPDPCTENSCSVCMVENCAVRKQAFQQKVNWTIQNITRNKKHDLD